MINCLWIHPTNTNTCGVNKADREATVYGLVLGWREDCTIVYNVEIRVHLKRTVGEIEHASSTHTGNVLYMRSGFMYTCVLSRRLQHCQPGRTTSTTVMVVFTLPYFSLHCIQYSQYVHCEMYWDIQTLSIHSDSYPAHSTHWCAVYRIEIL